uniref:Uncharacterized protein n=1 Tax=Rhizophora mucronata TaxID=61149 RepID=A0A2P2Q3G7_RHIMU
MLMWEVVLSNVRGKCLTICLMGLWYRGTR